MFKATLANPEQCPNPAKLVEIELLPHEGGVILGSEKRPSIKEFIRWLGKAGVKKEIDENTDGTVDFDLEPSLKLLKKDVIPILKIQKSSVEKS